MLSLSLLLCLFQHTLGTTVNEIQSNKVSAHLNSETRLQDLASVLGQYSLSNRFESNRTDVLSIAEGTYIGRDIEITHRSLELSGEWSSQRNGPGTTLVPSCVSKRKRNEETGDDHAVDRCLFSLANSTLRLKWMRISVVDTSAETGTPRLASVSSSMLSICESVLDLSPSTSPILVCSSTIDESAVESSVVLNKCSMSSESGEMRGVVETSAFPSFEVSVSVSIVGCSCDSQRIVGTDGIGLALTRTPRKGEKVTGIISSSLIGCSFMNMSSIGSSHLPRLPHLNQKMLGCVVSLTSSHLSGSTIRDMNNGGSILCSNSSFSSLLSSPNTDTNEQSFIATPGEYTGDDVVDGTLFIFFDQTTPIVISKCHFTGAAYEQYLTGSSDDLARPLLFYNFHGTVSVVSCSFLNFDAGLNGNYGWSRGYGAAVCFHYDRQVDDGSSFTATSSNFTSCSAPNSGGAVFISGKIEVAIDSCRFTDCTASEVGGGVACEYEFTDLSVVGSSFEHCEAFSESKNVSGGAIYAIKIRYHEGTNRMTMTNCRFVDCSSTFDGGAVYVCDMTTISISDTFVSRCFSARTGAIYLRFGSEYKDLSVSRVVFDGNRIDPLPIPGVFYNYRPKDFSVYFRNIYSYDTPHFPFDDCFTTVYPSSADRVPSAGVVDQDGNNVNERIPSKLYPGYYFTTAYIKCGPYLTDRPKLKLNERTGQIELEMKAKTPLMSQEYEVTVYADDYETSLREYVTFRMLFVNGTGRTMISPSESNLQYNEVYDFSSIIGVVPESSSSIDTNDNSFPVLPYAFTWYSVEIEEFYNYFKIPSLPTFSTLQVATAHLIESDPQSAFVVLVFDKEVWGWYEFVVEEEGEDVTIRFSIESSSKLGITKEFKVIGDVKLLTPDTTYTIKSVLRDPESDSPFVRMNETITFRIPKSQDAPPDEPEPADPEEPTEPEPEDPKDKKAMSPEMKSLLSWLVPLVACLLIALILAIVVIVLLRRRQQKNGEPAQKEMEVQEAFDVEKVEEFGVDCSNGVIHTDGISHTAFDSSSDRLPTLNHSRGEGKGEGEGEWVEVMACSGGFEISSARMTDTLYSVLHKEHRDVGKRGVGMQIVNGLKQVVGHRGWSDVLTRLSSHWILIEAAGNVQLKLQMNASEAEQEAAQAQTQNAQALPKLEGNEKKNKQTSRGWMVRKFSPEVVGSKGGQVDGHKASVFSLGLVLWEIETGQVPFGELDAVNAQRQSGTGIGPKMESLQNEAFVSLIRRCVSVDPEQRPTLTEVGEFLSSHPDETIRASRIELKE
ncbi:hypothetical protein BLNAU_6026 [Blattamonas nauphoetae]|uniref:Protein kinase domain-containing protein n=1 Tax=Blattamonas nauphoetae TaxID=2049346 RepID=A0ABQ9Y5I7_9EUKA|nr:hypothetical protein BLNAU_6026 [Blattamonas nauphoetae]